MADLKVDTQGWIELAAFADDDTAARWWEAYLAPATDALTPRRSRS
ncbi:hypothetical protein [Microbacterium lacticum]